jgi:hypothetical protein
MSETVDDRLTRLTHMAQTLQAIKDLLERGNGHEEGRGSRE